MDRVGKGMPESFKSFPLGCVDLLILRNIVKEIQTLVIVIYFLFFCFCLGVASFGAFTD